jgi:hypothetical protein
MENQQLIEQVKEEEKPTDTQDQTPETENRYFYPGDLLELNQDDLKGLTDLCRDAVEDWMIGSAGRRENLLRWNELLENVIEEPTFPWEGSSAVNVPMIAIHIVTMHSIFCRSVLTVDPLWYGRTLDRKMRETVPDIQDAMNYTAKNETNLVEACRGAFYNAPRDGLSWIKGYWCEKKTPVETKFYVESVDQFKAEFPTPEDAGLTPEQYQSDLEAVAAEANQENPYGVDVKYDRIDYRGPKYDVIDEADMVRAPYTATNLDDCRAYGHLTSWRLEELKRRAAASELWEDAVKTFCQSSKKSTSKDSAWRVARDVIEGISEGTGDFSDERPGYELVVRYKLSGDDEERKILCTYSHDRKMLLGAGKYPYLLDNFIPFRIISRSGRMAGISVAERLEDLNLSINRSLNLEINSEDIELAPIFKGKKNAKADFDPSSDENQIRPGTVWYLEDPKDFDQFKIQASDKNASYRRRQELIRVMEMLMGPTQLLSGADSPTDPNAPGNKTIALIQQSNMRIEDYINELRIGFDALGDFHLSLYDQFSGGVVEFENSQGEIQEFRRSAIKGLPRMRTHGVTANLNPEVDFAKVKQWFDEALQDPMIGGNPVRRRELWNRLFVAARVADKDVLLPPKPEVEQAQQDAMMKEAEKKVIGDLIKKGVIPPPPPPPAPTTKYSTVDGG